MLDTVLRQLLLLIQPLGFIWLCLIAITLLLWRKRQRAFAGFTAALVLFIYMTGATDVPGSMLRSLERPYAGVELAQLPVCDAVVMLGGGIEASRYEVGGFHLTRAGDRVLMAVEMMRLGKAPVLILGGGGAKLEGNARTEADLIRDWIANWRLVPNGEGTKEVISLGRCRDTHDEAEKVRALVQERGWQRVLLVTSATHMRRAAATFRTSGVNVVPVPCNFMTTISTTPSPATFNLPRYEGFEKVAIWLHEQVGWWEYRRRGWIVPPQSSD